MTNITDKLTRLKSLQKPLTDRLADCDLCPRECHVNRLKDELGFCRAGRKVRIFTAFLHKGEEPPISRGKGSGTIFFSGCSLRCVYCQNWRFSHQNEGEELDETALGRIMLNLGLRGASNINLVTPTHYLPQIVSALIQTYERGLDIPIVYNTSGYEKKEIIEKLNPIVDIFLADIRYYNPETSAELSGAPNYPVVNQQAIKTIYSLKSKSLKGGELKEGLIIRHLVLPGHTDESLRILDWLKKNTPDSLLSVMFQYQPYHEAAQYPAINRRVSREEYDRVRSHIQKLGLDGWIQELQPAEEMAGVHFKAGLKDYI